MVQNENRKILLHACCGICSAYPITLLQELGYDVVVYFSNSNLDTKDEYVRRLEAQKKVCSKFNVELLSDAYNHEEYLDFVAGLELEPERGSRCDKCIELRLLKTAQKCKELNILEFTTSLPISPYKNYQKIVNLGDVIASKYNLTFMPFDFKKKDGFLKTNKIAKELDLYRQNYCGCEFAK